MLEVTFFWVDKVLLRKEMLGRKKISGLDHPSMKLAASASPWAAAQKTSRRQGWCNKASVSERSCRKASTYQIVGYTPLWREDKLMGWKGWCRSGFKSWPILMGSSARSFTYFSVYFLTSLSLRCKEGILMGQDLAPRCLGPWREHSH